MEWVRDLGLLNLGKAGPSDGCEIKFQNYFYKEGSFLVAITVS